MAELTGKTRYRVETGWRHQFVVLQVEIRWKATPNPYSNRMAYGWRDARTEDLTTITVPNPLALPIVEGERIIAAAVRFEKQVYSLLPPARHGEVLRLIDNIYPEDEQVGARAEQGFVTSRNRFVDRVEARAIAVAANQLTERDGGLPELYSEDVW